ncbi:branched-chain amino acid ABC transporter permease [Oceanibacterium hippocampi]|uniref:Leucine/isoleucine/valine transporter permease subunit n=1 Tax=Oceanibacterium hippocampi TaxID=745714 RepID=A0A1Y5SJM1_9PROT|nr:branched-chain amino acid ABC transporter permease [Oceanibacterium hippocampi]SLN42391.1 leucine/isoleucine/valine transporter permease subunit [Oceanibacterium hippocampi]
MSELQQTNPVPATAKWKIPQEFLTAKSATYCALFLPLAALPLLIDSSFVYHIAILVCLNAIITSGLGVIVRVDQLSLAHGAFAGIGAYASALAVIKLGVPFLLSLVLAALAAGVAAVLLGRLVLGLKGVYFVLATFAFNELFRMIMLLLPEISGGTNGLSNIPAAEIAGLEISSKPGFYIFIALALAATLLVVWMILRSPIGRAFDAISGNLPLAQASGIPPRRYQILAFTSGSVIAGVGGGIMAAYVGFISPESFTFWFSVNTIIMLIVGGRYSIMGPVLGALLLTPLPEVLRSTGQLQQIIYGVCLIAILRFMPGGVSGLIDRFAELMSGRK